MRLLLVKQPEQTKPSSVGLKDFWRNVGDFWGNFRDLGDFGFTLDNFVDLCSSR